MTRARMAVALLVATWLLLWCAACATAHPVESLPPIPATAPSVLGPIRIVWTDSLTDENGQALWGAFAPAVRTIYLNTAAKANRAVAWQILFHELTHVALNDAGLRNVLPMPLQQALADAMGTQQAAFLLLRWPR